MKKIIALAAIAAACSTSAFAQVSNFTGPSVGVNLDLVSSSIELNDFAGNNAGRKNNIGLGDMGATAQAAYGFELSPKTVISVGATYGLTGYNGYKGTDSVADGSGNSTLKVKNVMSLYVEPGYLVNNTTLAYAKLGYESAKLDASFSDGSASVDINGMSYGFGMRTMLDKNLFIQAEVKRVSYNRSNFPGDTESNFKADATVGSVGIGYKF